MSIVLILCYIEVIYQQNFTNVTYIMALFFIGGGDGGDHVLHEGSGHGHADHRPVQRLAGGGGEFSHGIL